jgi:hypothetical protein
MPHRDEEAAMAHPLTRRRNDHAAAGRRAGSGGKREVSRPTGLGRRSQRLAGALGVLLLVGCFEEPVSRKLSLCFVDRDAVLVSVVTTLAPGEGAEDNPALQRRLAEERRALEEGRDEWRPRFAALDAPAARLMVEEEDGEIVSAERRALGEPGRLGAFFADTGVAVSFTVRENEAELQLVPGPSARATREQRERVAVALADWSEAIAGYLAAGARLWRHLDEHPERARPCLADLMSSVIRDATRQQAGDTTPDERALVEQVDEAREAVAAVLTVPENQTETLDELSRLVFDPFPARVTVVLPATSLEVEGFTARGAVLEVGGLGLWASLERLEGRWLAPDPLLPYLRAMRGPQPEHFDFEAFLAAPRRAASPPPDSLAVRRAIEEGLRPAAVYRAVWTLPSAESDAARSDWRTLPCPAPRR